MVSEEQVKDEELEEIQEVTPEPKEEVKTPCKATANQWHKAYKNVVRRKNMVSALVGDKNTNVNALIQLTLLMHNLICKYKAQERYQELYDAMVSV